MIDLRARATELQRHGAGLAGQLAQLDQQRSAVQAELHRTEGKLQLLAELDAADLVAPVSASDYQILEDDDSDEPVLPALFDPALASAHAIAGGEIRSQPEE